MKIRNVDGEVRAPAVAGLFYSSAADELRRGVRGYVAGSAATALGAPPKAIIAPHAGYMYSGPIAGSAFSALAPMRGIIERVVVLGPAHRVAFRGAAVPRARSFATPLGLVDLDAAAITELASLPYVIVSDEAHAGEHSIEVELPFVQEVLGDVSVVPIAVGRASDQATREVLERSWGGAETCIVVSSDLSHELPYAVARELDERTAHAIEELAPERVHDDQACGSVGVRALLRVARDRGLEAKTLDLRNSGDTAGSRERVVGYGAFAFT